MKREMSDLHSNLWSVANTSIGRLVFGEKTEQVKMRYHGVNTIIINTNGLTLPAEGQKPSNQAERNSSMVYGLLALLMWASCSLMTSLFQGSSNSLW